LAGMLNDHIAATISYDFDVKNTTTSRIRYRQFADFDNMSMSMNKTITIH
jgi:hypothetical protein